MSLFGPPETVLGQEIIVIKEPRANKNHQCDICLGVIKKGTRYYRSLVRARGGQPRTLKSHDHPAYEGQDETPRGWL